MRFTALVIVSAVVGLLAALPLGLGAARAQTAVARADVMPLDEVKPGMKGYGLTVFEGTQPERFEVEVIDVVENFRPRQGLILVKTKHPRLDVAKVVAGMSGSPIFIDGKMIGAYAYGWTFGKEPVAGVTPIENMLRDLVRPLPDQIYGWPLQVPPPQPRRRLSRQDWRSAPNRFSGASHEYDVRRHARQVARTNRRPKAAKADSHELVTPVATPLLMGGMTDDAVDMARELLGPVGLKPLQAGGGGGTEAGAPRRFVDGGAIGVQMIRGDMSAMGLGTVTRVEGDRLVAFGHPMMQAGATALPTAVGRVLWFLASQMRSFKIGMPVRPVGAMVNDRLASIVASHGAKAPTIPVRMKMRGLPEVAREHWQFEVAHERFMTPSFMAVALGNALQATAAERRDVSWTAHSRLKIKGYGELRIEDFGVSVGGTPEPRDFARSNLVDAVGGLLNNPWKPVLIESAEVDFELRFAREILRLRGSEILEPEIEAGQPARIRVVLEPYVGPPITRVISVPIPAHLAGQSLSLRLSPGYTEERDVADPESLADFIQVLENPVYPPKSLVVSYHTGDGAVSFKSNVAKNLPPGALDSIRPHASSIAPEAFRSQLRHVVPMPEYVVGKDRVDVTVKPVLR